MTMIKMTEWVMLSLESLWNSLEKQHNTPAFFASMKFTLSIYMWAKMR